MNKTGVFLRCTQILISVVMLGGATAGVLAAERNISRTNWTERWITNDIEVRMPRNVFVDHFHTNWVQQYVTNIVEVPETNWITRKVTNTIPVQATRDVHIAEYKTNWSTVTRTNRVPVEMFRTNLLALYQTNWRTLTVTNWETVLVMKTNWVTQPVTNVVQIDLLTNRVSSGPTVSKTLAAPEPIPANVAVTSTSETSDAFHFEASRTARPANTSVAEVLIKASWSREPETAIQVRQWKVESENGAILCYSQEQDFRRELPVGKYRIEIKAQKDASSPLLAGRGMVQIAPEKASILPMVSSRK